MSDSDSVSSKDTYDLDYHRGWSNLPKRHPTRRPSSLTRENLQLFLKSQRQEVYDSDSESSVISATPYVCTRVVIDSDYDSE